MLARVTLVGWAGAAQRYLIERSAKFPQRHKVIQRNP